MSLNETTNNVTAGSTNSSSTTPGMMDRFVDTVYLEIESVRNSQMIMGTMFLVMVVGMIVIVLCCVKHKEDGYYRVPPPKRSEEVGLVVSDPHKGRLPDARFEIELNGDDDDDD